MKTFDDLKFNLHTEKGFDTHAVMFFDNDYGISVITGEDAYTDDKHPYECAVIKRSEVGYCMVYDTPITDSVIGFCNKDKITEIMKQIQEL